MRAEEAPQSVRDQIDRDMPDVLRQIAQDISKLANRYDEKFDIALPPSVTATDLELWTLAALRDGIQALIAWRIASARVSGLTAERIAADLGYLTGGNLRRAFPEAKAIEDAYRRGDRSVTVRGLTIGLADHPSGA